MSDFRFSYALTRKTSRVQKAVSYMFFIAIILQHIYIHLYEYLLGILLAVSDGRMNGVASRKLVAQQHSGSEA